jgi:hypothetical protein
MRFSTGFPSRLVDDRGGVLTVKLVQKSTSEAAAVVPDLVDPEHWHAMDDFDRARGEVQPPKQSNL